MASTGNDDIVLAVLGPPPTSSSGLLQRKKTFRVKPAGNRHQPGCDRPEAIAIPPQQLFSARSRHHSKIGKSIFLDLMRRALASRCPSLRTEQRQRPALSPPSGAGRTLLDFSRFYCPLPRILHL